MNYLIQVTTFAVLNFLIKLLFITQDLDSEKQSSGAKTKNN